MDAQEHGHFTLEEEERKTQVDMKRGERRDENESESKRLDLLRWKEDRRDGRK